METTVTPAEVLNRDTRADALLRMTLDLHGTREDAAATPAGQIVSKQWIDGQISLDAACQRIAASEALAAFRYDALDAAEHELELEGISCVDRDRRFDQAYAEGRMTADQIVACFVASYRPSP